ncbi:hypothetical protein [Novosphingobium sp. BL-52-GroH]|uniref:hypothetical protein n=1 Tax=Novosphingobium sp. BL-52-GroH TaxID=3349877 RepID=UPI00384BD830
MSDMADPKATRPRPRLARGQARPTFLSPDLDRVVIMVTSLMAEVSALRDRLDTHEALAENGEVATRAAVEGFELDGDRQAAREARRDAMLNRMLRVLVEERDGDSANDPLQAAV